MAGPRDLPRRYPRARGRVRTWDPKSSLDSLPAVCGAWYFHSRDRQSCSQGQAPVLQVVGVGAPGTARTYPVGTEGRLCSLGHSPAAMMSALPRAQGDTLANSSHTSVRVAATVFTLTDYNHFRTPPHPKGAPCSQPRNSPAALSPDSPTWHTS